MLLAFLWDAALAQPRVRFEATPLSVVQAMTDLAAVKAGDVVYDLGCGDGRIVIAAARLGAAAACVDIDPRRIAEARDNARKAGVVERIAFRQEDLFNTDLREATVVMLFLSPDYNLALRQKLRRLRPGTRVVSHWHAMGDWEPQKKVDVRVDSRHHPVYLWVIAGS
ncbi:MAG: methyltransferase domain-containing protein [Burkholderiales bacterium]